MLDINKYQRQRFGRKVVRALNGSLEGKKIAEASSVTMVNKEIWQWLALAALAVLMVEWWVYHRRIA